MKNRLPVIFLIMVLFFFSLPLESSSLSYTIYQEELLSLTGEMHMAGGRLSLRGEALNPLEADFLSSNPEWLPEVHYEVLDTAGHFRMKQPITVRGFSFSSLSYQWNIGLGHEVPLDLTVTLGAAVGDLDFQNTSLENLHLTAGVSDVNLNLRDTPLLSSVLVKMGIGNLNLDLGGFRNEDLLVSIWGGIGRATIYLPREVGVEIKVKGGLGRIRAQGFYVYDSIYYNKAYGETDRTIQLEIRAGLGEILFILED